MNDKTLKDGDPSHGDAGPGQPFLFVVLECDRPRAGSARYSLAGIDQVTIGRGAGRAALRKPAERTLELQLPGAYLSRSHARLLRRGEHFVLEDAGSTTGSFVAGARVESRLLEDGDVLELGHSFFIFRAAMPAPADIPDDFDSAQTEPGRLGLTTALPLFAHECASLARIARTPLPVLLLGETGTGKELLAGAIHRMSARAGALVAANCGALPPTLVESQLFGHVRGAFTGAVRDEPGFVRDADHGTMFLDEIGDLAPAAQAALLRVLEEHEVVPVGTTRAVRVDVRVVAATHRQLDLMRARGEFRQDLYARLAGFVQRIPPLRERREDLGLLVAAVLDQIAPARPDLRLGHEVGRAFLRYRWPHNVRELKQCLAGMVALSEDGLLARRHLPEALARSSSGIQVPDAAAPGPAHAVLPASPDPAEDERLRATLLALLAHHGGNISEVARAMGKARMQVHRWCKRFRISPDDFR